MSLAETIGRPLIAQVVDQFYERVRTHATLAAPFGHVPDWHLHQQRLSYFWWVALGGERDQNFQYHVGMKHFQHGFTRALLADWLALFGETVQDILPQPQAEIWLALARHMGDGLAVANDQIIARHQENPHAPIDFAYPGAGHPGLGHPEGQTTTPAGPRPGLEDTPPRPA